MALLKAGVGALRMDGLLLDPTGAQRTGNATTILFTFAPGDYLQFDGHFQYDGLGRPSGPLDSVTSVENGKTHFTLTGVTDQIQAVFAQPTPEAGVAYVLDGDDKIVGKGRDDYLIGYDGNDKLYGLGGDDTLVGGHGADKLYGDVGADVFTYQSTGDSTVAAAGRDTIFDFSAREGDKIDLSQIDAITGNDTSNDAFTFTNRFHNVAGELVVRALANGDFIVAGDTDGINGADFSILVHSDVKLVATDFML